MLYQNLGGSLMPPSDEGGGFSSEKPEGEGQRANKFKGFPY